MLAGLPYVLWPIGSIFILASRKREDPFLVYHAVQALLTGALLLAGSLVLILGMFITFRVMPGSSSYLPAVFSLGVILGGSGLAMTILFAALFLGWRATEGEMLRIPLIGDFAEEKMLDQTGMTRRQFEAMCESGREPGEEEDPIPFPVLAEETPQPATSSRPEATRQARAQHTPPQTDSRPTPTQSGPNGQAPHRPVNPISQRRPAPATPSRTAPAQSQAQSQAQPHLAAREWEPLPPLPQSSGPVVREVDLIGHYKEKKVETGPQGGQKADVLRQWLSSVDND